MLYFILLSLHYIPYEKEYLENEGTSQTLLFLLEVEEYRRIPSVRFQQMTAKKIFNKFVHSYSIMPLPLEKATRESIEERLQQACPLLFQECVDEVLTYIETFQFPRFASSPLFNNVIAVLALEAVQPRANKRRASITLQNPSLNTGIRFYFI